MSYPSASITETPCASDLLGRALRDLRVSVTDRCNLRCTYCMPADKFPSTYRFLPREQLLTFEEIAAVVRAGVSLGVRKVRITGGEPLLRRDLPTLIQMLRETPFVEDIALTTNGLLLPRYAHDLKAAGLDRVTVSLDSPEDATAGLINGRGIGAAPVFRGIEAAQEAGFAALKVNMVVQRGVNDHYVLRLAEHFRHSNIVLRFIEFMDVGTCNQWRPERVVPSRDILKEISYHYPLRPIMPQYRGEVAARYAYEDGGGEIGFISSVTQPFCGDCSRLRLSSDGRLFTCLFGSDGLDIRGPLRKGIDEQQLIRALKAVWVRRNDRYSELRTLQSLETRDRIEMSQIGG